MMNTHSIILIILIILAALLLLVWLPLFIRSIRKAMKSNNQHSLINQRIMSTKLKRLYEAPTTETVEVATNGVLCQSLDGVTLTRNGYGDEGDQTWSGVDY